MAVSEALVTQKVGEYAQQGVQQAGQYAQRTLQSAGNGLIGTAKGAVTAPWTLAVNTGKEAISELLSSGWKVGAFAGIGTLLMPEWVGRAADFMNKPEWVTKAIDMFKDSPLKLAAVVGLGAAAIPAAIGGAVGAFKTLTAAFGGSGSSDSPAQENGVGLGTTIGTVGTVLAATYFLMGGDKKTGIVHDTAGSGTVEKPNVPAQPPLPGTPMRMI